MNGIFGHDSALGRLHWVENNLVYDMIQLDMNHAPCAGLIDRPVGTQLIALPLHHGIPPPPNITLISKLPGNTMALSTKMNVSSYPKQLLSAA